MKLRSKFLWQKTLSAFMIFALLSVPTFAQMAKTQLISLKTNSLSKVETELTQKISLNSIKSFTQTLAADEMEGRGTMQPGGDKAANWIAKKFKSLGLKPLGDTGSYLQSIDFTETLLTSETKFEVGGNKFVHGVDFGFVPLGVSEKDKNITADLIFVGYGMELFSENSDLLPKLKGKIVVVIDGPPTSIKEEKWEKLEARSKLIRTFIFSGAKGAILVGHGRKSDKTEDYIDYFGRRQISLASESSSSAPFPLPPVMMINKPTAKKLFAKSGMTFAEAQAKAEKNDFKSFVLNESASIVAKYKKTNGKSSNVVGFIEGSDPKLKSEAVIFTAHYDAYGVDNGKVYNGAADNALGTSEMIAVAEAFSKMKQKPKRSLIFLAVTGEEYGLYGSKHWAKNPTWNIKKIAANLNLDGVGTEVFGPVKNIVGYGAEHSTLGNMLADVAKSYGIGIMPDPRPEEKIFTRSDHYSFVERGIPALKLTGVNKETAKEFNETVEAWEKLHYHQPSDDVMKNWHWEGAKTVADIMGVLGLRIANQNKMPSWLESSIYGKLKRGHTGKLPE